MDSSKIVAYIIALFLPPLAVFMERGVSSDLWINLVLCLIIWFPAILHAIYIVSKSE